MYNRSESSTDLLLYILKKVDSLMPASSAIARVVVLAYPFWENSMTAASRIHDLVSFITVFYLSFVHPEHLNEAGILSFIHSERSDKATRILPFREEFPVPVKHDNS